ncbi:unnamed protein product [Cylicocyclus nassatus]|uniref:Uncharacterized protein n=1 Tax=Cylicocyclus nassatus TaxID=53992 RepID=A0AA36DVE1_CYLNA|nr:unnamed protein product [Cylicocyclus nassatus]
MQQDVLDEKRVVATKRVYIPPHNSILVPARCEGSSELEERVVWPSREDLPVGVFTVKNQELDIPVMNSTGTPMILKEGEELEQWGTENWRSMWEEMNPLMMNNEIPHLDREERRNILYAQLKEGSKVEQLDDDLKQLVDEFEEAFALLDPELTGTDRAEIRAKMELEGEEQTHGLVKEGGTAFAAPASAVLLERYGPK